MLVIDSTTLGHRQSLDLNFGLSDSGGPGVEMARFQNAAPTVAVTEVDSVGGHGVVDLRFRKSNLPLSDHHHASVG
jgi:hypothetical protein